MDDNNSWIKHLQTKLTSLLRSTLTHFTKPPQRKTDSARWHLYAKMSRFGFVFCLAVVLRPTTYSLH